VSLTVFVLVLYWSLKAIRGYFPVSDFEVLVLGIKLSGMESLCSASTIVMAFAVRDFFTGIRSRGRALTNIKVDFYVRHMTHNAAVVHERIPNIARAFSSSGRRKDALGQTVLEVIQAIKAKGKTTSCGVRRILVAVPTSHSFVFSSQYNLSRRLCGIKMRDPFSGVLTSRVVRLTLFALYEVGMIAGFFTLTPLTKSMYMLTVLSPIVTIVCVLPFLNIPVLKRSFFRFETFLVMQTVTIWFLGFGALYAWRTEVVVALSCLLPDMLVLMVLDSIPRYIRSRVSIWPLVVKLLGYAFVWLELTFNSNIPVMYIRDEGKTPRWSLQSLASNSTVSLILFTLRDTLRFAAASHKRLGSLRCYLEVMPMEPFCAQVVAELAHMDGSDASSRKRTAHET